MSNPAAVFDATDRTGFVALVAGEHAADVDRQSRFPRESVDALRSHGLLRVLVPTELGGDGAPVSVATSAAAELGRSCSSTAMIFAVHQAQVVVLAQHGRSEQVRGLLEEVVETGRLVTSIPVASSGPSGRRPTELDGEGYHVAHDDVIVPFGEHADAALVSFAPPDVPGASREGPSETELLVAMCTKPRLTVAAREGPTTLGLRGTRTSRFKVAADVESSAVLSGFGPGAAHRTLLATSRLLVSAALTGIAGAAMDRARLFAERNSAKARSAASLGPLRARELEAVHDQGLALVAAATRRLEQGLAEGHGPPSAELVASSALLVDSVTRLTVDVVRRASSICGIVGYEETSPFSMGRLVRDIWGGCLLGLGDDPGTRS